MTDAQERSIDIAFLIAFAVSAALLITYCGGMCILMFGHFMHWW
jgi:hypothetical protein